MVKTLNRLRLWFYQNRIQKMEASRDFYEQYHQLEIGKLEQKYQSKLQNREANFNQSILEYQIQAHIESPLLKETERKEIEQVNQKFNLLERVILQQEKRYYAKESHEPINKFEDKRKLLAERKSSLLSEITKKYHPDNVDLASAKQIYTEQESIQKEEMRLSNLAYLHERQAKLSRIERNHLHRIQKLSEKISMYQSKAERFETNLSPYEDKIDQDVILKVDHLSMHFGGLKAVDDLSFEVKKGSIFGLIGPNGAGKTTVFNCITRFYKATSGEIYYRDRFNTPLLLNKYKVHNVIKHGIVRTFQNVELIWELSVIDNLLVAAHTLYHSGFFGHLLNTRRVRQEEAVLYQKAMKIIQDLDLGQYAYMYPLGLPYGILKKVELARTLMVNPQLIILDEPAAGLNDIETESLAKTIRKIQSEYQATIFLVEHDMGLVMDICDTICAISFGKKLAIGSPKEIQQSKIVRDAYLGGDDVE